MQLICDGVKQKAEVLDVTLDEYRDVFVTARREFNTVIQVGDSSFRRRVSLTRSERNGLHARRGRRARRPPSGNSRRPRWTRCRCQRPRRSRW